MKRSKWFWATAAGAAFLATAATTAGGLLLLPRAEAEAAKPTKQDDAPKASLPIGRVVLFSSGVGYFQREGTVEGNARVDLSFDVRDINDLIKSMVVRDLDGGVVSAVSYDSNAPVERTLQSFAVNLHGNPSFGNILDQARGEKVEVVLTQANAAQPGTMTGTVIGVEHQAQPAGKDGGRADVALLNLWCADGMRAVKLGDVQRVRFLNPVLDSEFRKALDALAQSHDAQKKAVSVNFLGDGKRNVRVGYVVESPVWKTSYRLVLGKGAEDKPFLQGWAVVENQSDEDWKDVRMALVSGRPISFKMNLYDPLYVNRPVVEPELFASLRPVAYSGAMDGKLATASTTYTIPARTPPPSAGPAAAAEPAFGFAGGRLLRDGDKDEAEALKKSVKAGVSDGTAFFADEFQLNRGVASAASAAKLGDFFQYAVDKPVSLARQKSALLPIVNRDVEGTRVSIYNERTQAKFPLLGLKFKNTSGLHLMQGPVTVFEGNNYAGDARVLDLQPNEERLLSYAIDLGTEVNPVPSAENGKLTSVKAVKGVLHTKTVLRESKAYTVKNRNDQERLVLVEHPVRNEFKLVEGKPAETAADVYRFELKVGPGKAETQTVTEERVLNEQVVLTNLNDDQVRIFLNSPVVTDKVKKGLQNALELRWAAAKTQREIAELQRQLKTITDDQTRLRANIREMPNTAAAYKRYLDKFDQQETQIEKYMEDIKKLQGVEHTQRKELEDFLAGFNAE